MTGSDVLLLVPLLNIVCLFVCLFLNRITSFKKLKKNNNNKYQNTISPEDG